MDYVMNIRAKMMVSKKRLLDEYGERTDYQCNMVLQEKKYYDTNKCKKWKNKG